ncbi:transposase [Oceanithermus desulfurans]|uniref:Transposase n=1 Tax=Oceanithermus desulfurans TaxID=227924 RepID=A0ABR6P0W5_9DEIN|nr:transposase [Oceanithermus desulfurans]
MYTRKSRLSKAKRLRLLEHFVAGTTARAAAELVDVNRNTVNRFYFALRTIIAEEMEKAAPLHGEVEVDESYFGGRRKGKRGRGAAGKVPVFGLLKRGGRVYTLPIPNAKAKTLMPIIESRVVPDSIVYTDSFAGYNILDVSSFHHRRIDHGKAFAEGEENKRHINGIENFLESSKTASTQIQRHPAQALLPLPQRMRMALQRRKPQRALPPAVRVGQEGGVA